MTEKIYTIVWRPVAEADLQNIVDYIAQDNPIRAAEFGNSLRSKTLPLAHNPWLGHPARPGLPDYVRELVVHKHYVIFYRVLETRLVVQILRIKHTALQMP
ncbi:type II toxin-antitoxin system RelE/ParE family toxin [Brenneria tiliae]|uniref:Type II toxin-antitoxin system RelE/ParE family toxin n=1 Tax=Brenneria tiliae TaxID=2914984 RepID=A0ABT0N046_9GAMM|nr:type II toxin-antitoxin system RelE/ParE family toxin [Brenneria tiliae]MCL2894799.1 type II toxin-antitoxin system RelE/ParE family toxin [Brenneria tiliae]MCL2898483.1 type II toxin-antitoxin system RelE/ParE family toxin [Brenneria tiliae]MCL2902975.1 type II toxin-antitoxin system RelE/ParE family toxin [Brenneria tiliae]